MSAQTVSHCASTVASLFSMLVELGEGERFTDCLEEEIRQLLQQLTNGILAVTGGGRCA